MWQTQKINILFPSTSDLFFLSTYGFTGMAFGVTWSYHTQKANIHRPQPCHCPQRWQRKAQHPWRRAQRCVEMCGVGKNWFLWRFREGKTRKSTIIHSFMMFNYLIMFHTEIAKRSWYISYSDKRETQEFDPPWLAPSSKSRRSRKLSSSAAALSLPWSQRCLPHRQFDRAPGFFEISWRLLIDYLFRGYASWVTDYVYAQ